MVTSNLNSFCVLICCFTFMLNSCGHVGAVSYVATLLLGKSPGGSLLVFSVHSFSPVTDNCFSYISGRGQKFHERQTRVSILQLFAYEADTPPTELPRAIPKYVVSEGARMRWTVPIQVMISC